MAVLTGILLLLFLYQYGGVIAKAILPSCWLKSTDQRIQEAIAQYHADVIGQPDFALEPSGGSIICSSATYYTKSGPLYSIFGLPMWMAHSSPREVINPGKYPGQCWAMNGRQGFVTVQLRGPVLVTAVTIDHIPRAVAPSEDDQLAAPRDFAIIGKEVDMSSPDVILGRFSYRLYDKPLQQFNLKDATCLNEYGDQGFTTCGPNKQVFRIITLQVLSNHGNPEYTCIYRFRVHGREYKRQIPPMA